MPLKTPNLLMTLGSYQWYKTSNFTPTGFNINSSSLRRISTRICRRQLNKRRAKEFECQAFLSSLLKLTVKLLMLKALISRMLLTVKYRRMLPVG